MYQRLAIASGVGSLTVPEGAKSANLTVEGEVRFLIGDTPSATNGHNAGDGYQIILNGSELRNFKAYAVSASVIQVTYSNVLL